ncbi:MAG: CpaE family protein [Candidatus Limnocylindrales bacterium]
MANPLPDQIRLLLVEDVPQVAQYVRNLLNSQHRIKLLDIQKDGRAVADQVHQLRPDVLLIDSLLQGRMKGLQVAEAVRRAGPTPPIIILTVPQNPVQVDPARGVDRVLSMPFSGYDLVNILTGTVAAAQAASSVSACVVYTLYSPKGGVGRTTLAFNLAVAMTQLGGLRTALVDGSFQFGDLRALLKVPQDAPSLLDLPTDRIQESDLSEVMWRDPSGIDILLAPPRVEMSEMITARDLDKVLSLLRRVYNVVIIDTPATLGDVVLTLLDAADAILQVVTWDSTTLHNTRAMGDTFRAIGYEPGKLRYLLNRADANGGLGQAALVEQLGRVPEYAVVSDGRLVVECNNQGLPFVLAEPGAAISRDVAALATALQPGRVPVAAGR